MAQIIDEISCIIDVGLLNEPAGTLYLSAIKGGSMQGGLFNTNAKAIGEREQFNFIFKNDLAACLIPVRIKTHYGKYLKIKSFGPPDQQNRMPLSCGARQALECEQFVVCLLDTKKFAIRTADGSYLSAAVPDPAICDDDLAIGCVDQESDASWFILGTKHNDKKDVLPEIKQKVCALLSTNSSFTEYAQRQYVAAWQKAPGDAFFPTERLHVWASKRRIIAVTLEGKNGVEIGLRGNKTAGVEEHIINIGKAEYISSITWGFDSVCVVAIRLENEVEDIICEFTCRAFSTHVLLRKYKAPSGYGLVGVMPGPSQFGKLDSFEALFCAMPSHQGSLFNIVSYRTDEVMALYVTGLNKCEQIQLFKGKMSRCKESDELYPPSDSDMKAAWPIYVHNLTIGGGGGASRICGAITASPGDTYFPKGTSLRVLENEKEYCESALLDDHSIVMYGNSVFYFAADKLQDKVFTFILSSDPMVEYFFEVQCIVNNLDKSKQNALLSMKNIDFKDSRFPYFWRPIYKMSEVLADERLSEPPVGAQPLSIITSVISPIATWIITAFGVSSGVAEILSVALLGSAAAMGVYSFIRLCSSDTVSKEKFALKDLIIKVQKLKLLCDNVLYEYNKQKYIPPNMRPWPFLNDNSKVITKKFGILVFVNANVNGTDYTISQDELECVAKGFYLFADTIGKNTKYNVIIQQRDKTIYQKINIPVHNGENYLEYSDVFPYSKSDFPPDEYPYLIVIHPGQFGYAGLTTERINNGQSLIAIPATGATDISYVCSLFLHEFIHVMQGITSFLDIVFPDPDNATHAISNVGWKLKYGVNHSGLDNFMGYYLDILDANISYLPPNQTMKIKVGLFQSIWKLAPGFNRLGTYRIRALLSKRYLAWTPNSMQIEEAAYAVSEDQYWIIWYEHDGLIRISPYSAPYLYWDVDNASPSGIIKLCRYRDGADKNEQSFRLKQAADGEAQIISLVVDPNHPTQERALQRTQQSPLIISLEANCTSKKQKWFFENVTP